MKKTTLVLFFLALLGIRSNAADKKDAMPVLRNAVILNMALEKTILHEDFPFDIQPCIDTLQTMLYPEGLDRDGEMIEALGKLTLNSFYALISDPKVRYNDIGNSIVKLKRNESLWSASHVIGATYYCIEALEQKSYDNIITIAGHGVKVHEKLLNGRETEMYSMLLTMLADAYFNKQKWKSEAEVLAKHLPIVEKQSGRSSEDYMETLYMYSQALSMSGDYTRTDSCLLMQRAILESQGLTDSEVYYDVLNNLADNYMDMSRISDAERVLVKMKGTCPVGSDYYTSALEKLSEIYTEMREYEKALDVLQNALSMYDGKADVDVSNLYPWIVACQNPMATSELSRLRKIIDKHADRSNPLHLCIMVSANADSHEYAQQRDLVSKIEQMEKDYPLEQKDKLYQYMSQMYLAIDDYEGLLSKSRSSLADTERLVGRHHPLYMQTRVMLGGFYSMAGQYHKSMALLDSCAHSEGITPDLLWNIWSEQADIYAKMGNFEKSNDVVKKMLGVASLPSQKISPLERMCVNIISELELRNTNADEDQTSNSLLAAELLRY